MDNILFVGNSFTYYNDLPALFERLSNAAGHPCEVASVTRGGWYLSRYADPQDEMGRTLRAAYAQRPWDYIVLQDQSLNPAANPQNYLCAVSSLAEWMCPRKRFVLYQTWAYHPQSVCLRDSGFSYDTMWRALSAAGEQAAARVHALRAPVGAAFSLVQAAHPDINLYADDLKHPSPDGTLLAACVLLRTIFPKSTLPAADSPNAPLLTAVAESLL